MPNQKHSLTTFFHSLSPFLSLLLFIFLILSLSLIALAACQPQPADPPAVPTTGSDANRELEPQVDDEALAQLSAGNSRFALDLFQTLRTEEGNLFFSPYSISVALAMTYAGAEGETAAQMADTLHFDLPDEALHPTFNALDLHLTPAEPPAEEGDEGEEEDERFRLAIANSLWAQDGFPLEQTFLDLLARHYGAGLRLVDFLSEDGREEARAAINAWVERQTEGKIQDLIPQGALTQDTRLVLANAIYFLGKWVEPFEEADEQPFTLPDGQQVDAPMMSRRADTAYAQGDGYQALALDYKETAARMILLVPDAGRYDDFEASLDQERFAQIVAGLESTDVDLTMPKFEFESDFELSETLEEMGMPAPFALGGADFSGISAEADRDLYISAVIHKAFVAVDEEGTEAAAATGVVVGITSAPPPPAVSLTIDRPFLFAIQDAETGALLFLGRVLDPTAG